MTDFVPPRTTPLTPEQRAYWHGLLEGKSGWDAQDLALAAALDELDARDKVSTPVDDARDAVITAVDDWWAALSKPLDALIAATRADERRLCEAEREREIADNDKFFALQELTDEQFAEQCRERGHDPATFPEVVEAGAEQSWKTMRVFVQTAYELREARADVERWSARNRELEERLARIVNIASGRGT